MPTWTASSGSWIDPANWSGGVPNGSGAIASFSFGLRAGGSVGISIPELTAISVGILNVNMTGSTGITFQGSLSDSGTGIGELIFDNGAADAQLNVTTLATTNPTTFSSLGGLQMQLLSNLNVNVANAGSTADFSLPVIGTGKLIKSGAGILNLNGVNTFSGGIDLTAGVLTANSDAALGSGAVTISNNALFRSFGTIDNVIGTATGATGAAFVVAAAASTLTLTGTLSHLSNGIFTFGSAADTGTIVAQFATIVDGPTLTNLPATFEIAGGTLIMGNAFSAQNLFNYLGSLSTRIATGATLDTNGLATTIANLDMNGGTIRSSSGVLDLSLIIRNSVSQTGTIEGTAGADRLFINVDFSHSYSQLVFSNWTAGLDLIQIEGSGAGNTINGSLQNEVINGNGGNDEITSRGGIDTINGGDGDDRVVLNFRSNGSFVEGGAGLDFLDVGSFQAADSGTVTLGSISGFELIRFISAFNLPAFLEMSDTQFAALQAAGTMYNGQGTIIVNMSAPGLLLTTPVLVLQDESFGSFVQVRINGTSGTDVVKTALEGNYTINGNDGTDQLRGGNGRDTINGGDGNDKIMGLGAADTLVGGAGADQFRFLFKGDSQLGGEDQILDFLSGTDKLDFRGLDANPNLAGRQTLTFIDTAAFVSNGTAQIRWVDLGADLGVFVDLDGNGTADMAMLLVGAGAQVLSATDFLL
jgi:autotransporter-associated beta strand protein